MGEMCLNRLATDEEGRLALPIVRGSRAARSALGEDLWAGVMSIVIGRSLGASSRATLSRPRAFFSGYTLCYARGRVQFPWPTHPATRHPEGSTSKTLRSKRNAHEPLAPRPHA